ncbi:MAG TPA: hypothetical protein VLS91_02765 [Acidimicrobiales bacterium]|nr:hypothetical protein [Acidimicrobiales bacterium]
MEPSTSSRARGYLVSLASTQAIFFALLSCCVAIDHSETAQVDGVSFYGVYHRTVVLLALAFVVAAWGLWKAAGNYADLGAPALTVYGVRVVALGLFVVIATPFNQGTFLNWTHMTAGVAMALVQGAITIALVRWASRPAAWGAFGVQLFGGLLAAFSLPDWHFPYMLTGEVIYQVGFAAALLTWMVVLASAPLRVQAATIE